MEDTPPAIQEKMAEMIRKKSPEERFRMGCSMFDFSKKLITAAILRDYPDLDPAGLRRELFLRFYGEDFDPKTRKAILDHLGRTPIK